MNHSSPKDMAHGAYGLTISGLRSNPAAVGLVPVPADQAWPSLAVRSIVGIEDRPKAHVVDDERAVILLIEDEWVEVDRHQGRATFHTRAVLEDHDLVHPYLASPAGVFAQWHGGVAVHAGGAVIDGGAWALLGDKGAGKTTMLAELHRRGWGVVADDMMVLMDGTALAGPRCLDLRAEGASRVTGDHGAVHVRGGSRIRLPLPDVPSTIPFAGWIVLEPASTVEACPIPLAGRLPYLRRQLMMGIRPVAAGLDLLPYPMWALRTPRTWAALPAAIDTLLAAIRQGGARAPENPPHDREDHRPARRGPESPRSAP